MGDRDGVARPRVLLEPARGALPERNPALATMAVERRIAAPLPKQIGRRPGDVGQRPAGPEANIHVAEARIDGGGKPQTLRRLARGAHRAHARNEVTAERVSGRARQKAGQRLRLQRLVGGKSRLAGGFRAALRDQGDPPHHSPFRPPLFPWVRVRRRLTPASPAPSVTNAFRERKSVQIRRGRATVTGTGRGARRRKSVLLRGGNI